MLRTAKHYVQWCDECRVAAFPATYSTVGGYIGTVVAELKGSTKSVSNRISALHIFSQYVGARWLSRADKRKLHRVVQQWKLEDTVPVKHMRPLVLSDIERALRVHLDVRSSVVDKLVATMALTAHNGLLRGGELLSGLKVKDVTWERRTRSVILHLYLTKTERSGAGVNVRITDYAGEATAYKYLWQWFQEQELHGRGELFVFPEVQLATRQRAARLNFYRSASKKWFFKAVRALAVGIGADPRWVSPHSFRAGGATDLFILGVPYPKIKLYGRWRSDAALVYYRAEVEVSATIATAFANHRRVHRVERERCRVGVVS